MQLISILEEELVAILTKQEKPIMEHRLIKLFSSLADLEPTEDRLYIQHFSLFHALYKLKHHAGKNFYYLHLDPMRIRLVRIPPAGQCGHYDDISGSFCLSQVNGMFCSQHQPVNPKSPVQLTFDPLYDFYMNSDNITFGNSQLLQQLMNGIIQFAFNKKEIEKALHVFGVTKPTRKILKKRYHKLALQLHPDAPNGSEKKMKELNSAYTLLQHVFII